MALPIIPTRFVRYNTDQPQNHCSVRQVMSQLRGTDLSAFNGANGTLTDWQGELHDYVIPEVTALVVKELRQPYDWCRKIWYTDGPAGNALTLPDRNIYDVNLVYMRILPGIAYYAFGRIRRTDGTEFTAILGTEPAPPPAENPGGPAIVVSPRVYTGDEDADLFIDTRSRTLRIPPSTLGALGLPFVNFDFLPGVLNIEVHYRFGFPPTVYEDGAALTFDGTTGILQNPQPDTGSSTDNPVDDMVDWSSGMPKGLTMSVARLVANKVLRQQWRTISRGMGSISVDGASESYAGGAYAGELDREDQMIMQRLAEQYGVSMVL